MNYPTTFATPIRNTIILVEHRRHLVPPSIHMIHAWGHVPGHFALDPFVAGEDGRLEKLDIDPKEFITVIGTHVDRLTQTAIAAAKAYRKENPDLKFDHEASEVHLDRGFWLAELPYSEIDGRTSLATTTNRHYARVGAHS